MAGVVKWKVKKLIDKKGINVTEFAQLTGLGYRTALDIYKEKYDRVGLATLAKICDALSVGVSDLLEYTKED